MPKLRFLKSVSLADQKVETPWWKDGEKQSQNTLIKRWRHPDVGFWSQCHLLIKRCRHPNIGFWSQCHLLIKRQRHPDEKMEETKVKDTLIKRWRHPNIGVWSQCHLLIKRWRHPDQKAETPKLRCLKSVSWAGQKVETTPHQWKLELRFLKSVSPSDQKVETQKRHPMVETPCEKVETPKHRFLKSVSLADQKAEKPWSKGGNTLIKRCRHPNLGFWSQCHLLIKRWRHPPLVKVGTVGFWSQCDLLIKRQRHPDQKAEEVSVTCWSKSETPWSKGVDTQT